MLESVVQISLVRCYTLVLEDYVSEGETIWYYVYPTSYKFKNFDSW